MATLFDGLYAGGRGLIFSVHGRAATYYTAAGTSSAVTVTFYEQIGATDDIQVLNLTIRASDVAAPAEGDYLNLDGETTNLVVVNVKEQPNGDFVLRCRSRITNT